MSEAEHEEARRPPPRRAILLQGLAAMAASAGPALAAKPDPVCHAPPRAAPFVARFQGASGAVTFIATAHSDEVASPSFRLVAAVLRDSPAGLLIVEGVPTSLGPNPELLTQADTPPARGRYAGGEARYGAALALAAGATVIGGEPDDADIAHALLRQGYGPADVLGAHVVRALGSELRMGGARPGESLRLAAQHVVDHYAGLLGRPVRFDFSDWYRARFGRPFEDDPALAEHGSPCGGGPIPALVHRMSELRNAHLARLTLDELSRARAVTLIFGAGHFAPLAAVLAPRLGPARYDKPAAATISRAFVNFG